MNDSTGESKGTTIVQGNQYVINITGDGSSQYSFFSGVDSGKLSSSSTPAPHVPVIAEVPLPQIKSGSV